MARTFYPRKSVYVEASELHPAGTSYKVSIGDEDWEGVFQTVVKVQMVVDGKIQGRKSPSYFYHYPSKHKFMPSDKK